MNPKIAAVFVVSCLFFSGMVSAYPGGCYECEEEVWEEVPCDEIASNSTAARPPPPCVTTTTTTTPMPETTTASEEPPTTTPTTPPSTVVTTTPDSGGAEEPEETTTQGIETTTPSNEAYKKCYCECKSGCKEFCRKVITHPESKKQIVQVSEISEPVPYGRIESTHYHQRKLIPVHSGNPPKCNCQDYPKAHNYNKPVEDYSSVYNSIQSYYKSPVISPHYNYARARASAGAGIEDLNPDLSYVNKHQTLYFSTSPSELHDLPRYFSTHFSKAAAGPRIPNYKSNRIPHTSNHAVPCPRAGSFSSPVPANEGLSYDSLYDPYYNPTSVEHYDPYPQYPDAPNYSLSYSR
ncbi:uncharacterized protein LOC142225675 [Haematobia irritans]|uniref:uncharacterized protein LOC142225675 n=1 Tax=Haematobia irritans TaxID=7368 RepID=UPI003F5044DA